MRAILRLIAVVVAIVSVSCSSADGAGGSSGDARLTIVAAFYPIAEAASAIGGDCVDVVNLTPPGVEPHDLELTPDDVEAIASADVVLYLGSGFQPSVQDAIGDAQGTTLDVLSLVDTEPAPDTEAEEGLLVDPHVWLDPGLWARAVVQLAPTIASADPDSSCDFAANAEAYASRIAAIDRSYMKALADCRGDVIVTNHAAFGYLAAAYGLNQEAISGLQPDAEPTPERIAELEQLVQEEGVTTIFSEQLVSPEVAQTLADEAGVQVATLNTLEGLTPDEVEAGDDYASVMRTNLETLRGALDCS